jgi:hypothetical protein
VLFFSRDQSLRNKPFANQPQEPKDCSGMNG